MISSLLPFFTLAIAYVTWRVARNYFITSPLDNIPGPASVSLLKGMFQHLPRALWLTWLSFVLGNLGQLYNRFGWEFMDTIGTRYNKVVKLHGLFGVSDVVQGRSVILLSHS